MDTASGPVDDTGGGPTTYKSAAALTGRYDQ